jgi:hypothetical protein
MPRDFLCLCQPRFSAVSRGEIFIQDFPGCGKAGLSAADFHPGTGTNIFRNWDAFGVPVFGRVGVAYRRIGVSANGRMGEWAGVGRLRANVFVPEGLNDRSLVRRLPGSGRTRYLPINGSAA